MKLQGDNTLVPRVAGLRVVESLKNHFMDTSTQSYVRIFGNPSMCIF